MGEFDEKNGKKEYASEWRCLIQLQTKMLTNPIQHKEIIVLKDYEVIHEATRQAPYLSLHSRHFSIQTFRI